MLGGWTYVHCVGKMDVNKPDLHLVRNSAFLDCFFEFAPGQASSFTTASNAFVKADSIAIDLA